MDKLSTSAVDNSLLAIHNSTPLWKTYPPRLWKIGCFLDWNKILLHNSTDLSTFLAGLSTFSIFLTPVFLSECGAG